MRGGIICSCMSLDMDQNKTHYIKWGLYILVYNLIFEWSSENSKSHVLKFGGFGDVSSCGRLNYNST